VADETPPACDPALLDRAGALVREAGALALKGFRSGDLGTERKADGTVVTDYDRAVERLLRNGIAASFPDDGVLGEEEDEQPGASGRRWILDPIDGTAPYARGIVTWGVLVACEDRHGPLLGIAACPWAGETASAGRGLGCTEDGRPTGASRRDALSGAVLVTSGIEWWPPGAFGRVTGAGVKVRTWGNVYGLVLAATGRVDAFFDAGVKPWDIAPAPVLITEGGGRFATLDGSGALDAGTALACGEPLLEPLLALLRG
jgi:fructose-1,6-bisphosphatase/inositol monophosphatase family enzyme